MKNIFRVIFHKVYFYLNNPNIKSSQVSLKAKLGKNVGIRKNSIVDSNCEIGNYTTIGRNCNITKANIGKYCSIANNVSIGQGEHDINKISTNSIFYDNSYKELTKEPCIIENDVWIGTDSIILRGVKVHNGAVIGANSVVTKDIPPYAVAVGSPAKVIKYRLEEVKINKVIKSEWWNLEKDSAKLMIEELMK